MEEKKRDDRPSMAQSRQAGRRASGEYRGESEGEPKRTPDDAVEGGEPVTADNPHSDLPPGESTTLSGTDPELDGSEASQDEGEQGEGSDAMPEDQGQDPLGAEGEGEPETGQGEEPAKQEFASTEPVGEYVDQGVANTVGDQGESIDGHDQKPEDS